MSESVVTEALRIWALEFSPLSKSAGAALRRKQNANLISHIYERSGNGTLPISAGKLELGTRSKLFKAA